MKLTAIIEADGDGYVSLCPELDIASQGPATIFGRRWSFFSSVHPPKRCRNASAATSISLKLRSPLGKLRVLR